MSRWDAFVDRVHRLVRAVPRGRVVTYGQIARLAGQPRAAREVGWIAHAGGDHLPWQRVVNRWGGLATGYQSGRAGHKRDLLRDGVVLGSNGCVDLNIYQWWPDLSTARRLRLPEDAVAAAWAAHRARAATSRRS